MAHPYTSKHIGYRAFDGSSFGGLEETDWEFDGTESDVWNFAEQELGSVVSVKAINESAFDVLLENGDDYRVFTRGI